MELLKSVNELDSHRKVLHKEINTSNPTIIIPSGTCGQASGANDLIRMIKKELLENNLTEKIDLRITGCHGYCEMEPSLLIKPSGIFYPKVKPESIPEIVKAVLDGKVVDALLFQDGQSDKSIEKQKDIPFFKRQTRTIMGQNEDVDPIHISDYIRSDGYLALSKVLKKNDRAWIVEEVKKSGLRGRGGAGFLTGLKWGMLAARHSDTGKYLVCNADEGDPGAYMDRCVLEGNPHSILEGMIIGGFATGATEGILYVRNEYPLAIKHLVIALRQARQHGLLGENILGSGFSFDINIVRGAGAFVCGEETALIKSIEGVMGEPKQRPPFPIQKGIEGKPTVINNVETWANIPVIIKQGADKYSKVGTKGNSGTKIFSLVGKIKNTGLVEIPMGATIDEVVNTIGGGPSKSKPFKAVQTGGPSGGCLPVAMFDLPIDYDSLQNAKSIMGSGGMIAMDENTCMVDVAKYFMSFLKDESCGKCFVCRKGTQRMYEMLEDISEGKAELSHLDLLEELAVTVRDASMCGLGQTASNPVLSALHYFKDEYVEHIENHKCRAGVCKTLIKYSVNDNCTGCQLCAINCPVDAIEGEKKKKHLIKEDVCIKCGLCESFCKFDSIEIS